MMRELAEALMELRMAISKGEGDSAVKTKAIKLLKIWDKLYPASS